MAFKSLPSDVQEAIWIGDSLFVDKIREIYSAQQEEQPDFVSTERGRSLKPQSLDVTKTRLIMLPINTGNMHWSLVTIFLPLLDDESTEKSSSSLNEGLIVFLDSLGAKTCMSDHQKQLMECLIRYAGRRNHSLFA